MLFAGLDLTLFVSGLFALLLSGGYFAFLDYIKPGALWFVFAMVGGAILILFG